MGVIACCDFVPLIFGLYWSHGMQTGFIASLLASFFSMVAWNFTAILSSTPSSSVSSVGRRTTPSEVWRLEVPAERELRINAKPPNKEERDLCEGLLANFLFIISCIGADFHCSCKHICCIGHLPEGLNE
jgi:hypothetical protein